MMNEKVVREVAETYLRKVRRPFSSKKGAGPDILSKGTAIEIKGIGLRKRSNRLRALKQLAKYAIEHKSLEIFFPLDVLDGELAWSLFSIEAATKEPLVDKPIIIYVVTKLADGKYALKKFQSAEELVRKVQEILRWKISPSRPQDQSTSIEMITGVAMDPSAAVRHSLQDEANSYWTKVEIEAGE